MRRIVMALALAFLSTSQVDAQSVPPPPVVDWSVFSPEEVRDLQQRHVFLQRQWMGHWSTHCRKGTSFDIDLKVTNVNPPSGFGTQEGSYISLHLSVNGIGLPAWGWANDGDLHVHTFQVPGGEGFSRLLFIMNRGVEPEEAAAPAAIWPEHLGVFPDEHCYVDGEAPLAMMYRWPQRP